MRDPTTPPVGCHHERLISGDLPCCVLPMIATLHERKARLPSCELIDGPALLRRLQAIGPPSQRLIFITGGTLGLSAGPVLDKLGPPVIEKPISPEEMRRIIHETLAARNGAAPMS
jgi:hypothetical protein